MIPRLKTILANALGVAEDAITDESTMESIGADSLDLVGVSFAIADEFIADVDDSEIQLSMTVSELAALIESKQHDKTST
jgi:acyl carrier protein